MKLDKLTENIRIDREIDAPEIDIRDLLGVKFTLYKFRMKSYKGQINWVQCLIGSYEKIPLKKDRQNRTREDLPRETRKRKKVKGSREYAYEFHGDYQGLISYLKALENYNPNDPSWFLPIEEAEIVKDGEYIFKGSTNKVKYINKSDYVKSN